MVMYFVTSLSSSFQYTWKSLAHELKHCQLFYVFVRMQIIVSDCVHLKNVCELNVSLLVSYFITNFPHKVNVDILTCLIVLIFHAI